MMRTGPAARRRESMTIFYGWVIVAVGIVVTCIGLGSMLSLSVFLQPMSGAMGWSRTGISAAALLNFLCMGVGSFAWDLSRPRPDCSPGCPLFA